MIFLYILSIIVSGFLLLSWSSNQLSTEEKVGLGYLLGAGIFSLVWFLSNWWLNIAFTQASAAFIIVAQLIIFLAIAYSKHKSLTLDWKHLFGLKNWWRKATDVERIVLGIIVFWGLTAIILSMYWPVTDWDSIVLYDSRAKVFAATGFMWPAIGNVSFFGYPLNTSLLHTLSYVCGFNYPGVLHSLTYISLLLVFVGLVKRFTNWKIALVGTLMLAVNKFYFNHSLMTYSNLAYSTYISLGFLYLVEWVKTNHTNKLIIATLLIGLSAWVRSSEPFWLLSILLMFVIAISKRKFLDWLSMSLVIVSIRELWKEFKAFSRHTDYGSTAQEVVGYSRSMAAIFSRGQFADVMPFLFEHLILPYLLSWVILTLCILFFFDKRQHCSLWRAVLIMLILSSCAVATVGTLIFSFGFPQWQEIGGSLTRMMMLVEPLIIFLACITLSSVYKKDMYDK